jgi:hypothetical protein
MEINIKENGVLIDDLLYPITKSNFKYNIKFGSPKYCYSLFDSSDFYNRKYLRVYNHSTKEHYYLERAWPDITDNNLLFVDFPRSDGPIDSWASHVTQHACIRTWAREGYVGEFVRYKIVEIGKDNYCKVEDGYNSPSGWYARDCFYKINKRFKIE